jgi:hypothetical protein
MPDILSLVLFPVLLLTTAGLGLALLCHFEIVFRQHKHLLDWHEEAKVECSIRCLQSERALLRNRLRHLRRVIAQKRR